MSFQQLLSRAVRPVTQGSSKLDHRNRKEPSQGIEQMGITADKEPKFLSLDCANDSLRRVVRRGAKEFFGLRRMILAYREVFESVADHNR